MKISNYCVALLSLVLSSLSVTADPVSPVKGKIAAAGATRTMTVVRVDQGTREVVLRSGNGEEATFIAGPEVRNLAQVEAGDKLSITYAEGLAVRVYPVSAGVKGRIENTEISRAPLGTKPYGMITRRIELTGQVAELDRETRMATLAGKHGSLTLRVADDVDLSNVAVGDTVRVDHLERLSISVEAPAN